MKECNVMYKQNTLNINKQQVLTVKEISKQPVLIVMKLYFYYLFTLSSPF